MLASFESFAWHGWKGAALMDSGGVFSYKEMGQARYFLKHSAHASKCKLQYPRASTGIYGLGSAPVLVFYSDSSKASTPRHFGYVEHPQKKFPALVPFDALRLTISPAHFGHVGTADF